MGYGSVDKIQNLLADEIFHYTNDKKKASGRALGTFIEIITYYFLKAWDLEKYTAIERPLPEYANDEITHNVEFTLHGNKFLFSKDISDINLPITSTKIINANKKILGNITNKKSNQIISSNEIIRNACTVCEKNNTFINAYFNHFKNNISVYELLDRPFAMFECKRVGVEEGNKKGPQTIEKAKQGSYVAKTVSSLQKIRLRNGSIGGLIQEGNNYKVDDYYKLLDYIINSNNKKLLNNLILTVGIVSNHGNWFTSDNPNKELKVLAQSYDWLLFLTDKGISEFITDLLINPNKKYAVIKSAFNESYRKNKKGNVFTKVKITKDANMALIDYFNSNLTKIESWFNIISPIDKKLQILKDELFILCNKKWEKIYK